MDLESCILKRRDTRHFLGDPIPPEIVEKALWIAHQAPSVGMSEPWRFVQVETVEVKDKVYQSFSRMRKTAEQGLDDAARISLYRGLKLEAIHDAPLGLAVYCEFPQEFTIGTVGHRDTLVWSCACAIQNMWLYLTSEGYSLGWVSILDYEEMAQILGVPKEWQLLGYLCLGKPASDYGGKPMLEKEGWKGRSRSPVVLKR